MTSLNRHAQFRVDDDKAVRTIAWLVTRQLSVYESFCSLQDYLCKLHISYLFISIFIYLNRFSLFIYIFA